MRRAALVLMTVLIASPAFAEIDPALHWRECQTDEECVLVDGTCDKTAVNVGYKDEATAYYKKLAREASCPAKFWQPKEVIAQCKPLAGSKAHETSDVKPHSSCAAVAKPQVKR